MAYEKSNGKVRQFGPRASDNADHADGANAVDRGRDHHDDGRFRKGNQAAKGTGPKRAVRKLVPARGRVLFEELCRQLGADGGVLAYLHTADTVTHQIDALELAELARAKGLDTPDGRDLQVRAQKSSELAHRAATAALDAARLFRNPRTAVRKAKRIGVEP